MRRLSLLACLLLIANPLFAAPAHEWFVLRLGDRQIGYIERSREVVGLEVRSREYFRARFNRNGVPLTVTTEEKHRELADGTPLQFSFRQKLGESEMRMSGEMTADRNLRLRVRSGQSSTQRRVAWPEGALLMEGVRLRELAMPHAPGSIVSYRAFNPASLEAVETVAKVIGPETLRIDGRDTPATRIEHTLSLGGSGVNVVAHVDAHGRMLRTSMPLFGRDLVIERSSAAEARLPDLRTDIYDFTLVASPTSLDAASRLRDLDYRLRLGPRDPGGGLPITQQDWRAVGRQQLAVRVLAVPGPDGQSTGAAAEFLVATTWINADAPAIRRFAERATATAGDDAARMLRLEHAVRRHIKVKSLQVGYASAIDAFQRREGDCTEHALLLAASARSIGIPARIVIGLVYADRFAGRDRVFVPHAWTQARVDGRWQNFDAAQPGFGTDHLALAISDGDPSDYYASLERISTLRIESIAPATP